MITLPSRDTSTDTKFPFFVIEGVDGSGKSSLAPLVADSIAGAFYEYPQAFKPAIAKIDEQACPESRFLFYMGYNAQTSNDIAILTQQKPVVCVRYLYSTMVYHIVKGVSEKVVFDIAKSTPLLRPKQVIFLDVSDKNVQLQRLSERGILEEDIRVMQQMELIRSTYLRLSSLMPNFTYLDTSNMTKSEVVEAILEKVDWSLKELSL